MYGIFFVIGTVLILGYVTAQVFERTKIPDIIILIFAGMLAGPILNIGGIMTSISTISELAPFIGVLALIILLFDGGLNLDLFKVIETFRQAFVFTALVFSLTVLFLGISMNLIFGWTYLEGFLLGAVLGGTSSAIVFSIVSKLTMSERSKIILALESVLTDALCIIAAIALIGVISLGTMDIRNTASSIVSAFSTAAIIGAVFAVFWAGIISKHYVKQVVYSMTLAAVFILYSIVEMVKSNGAVAVLVFALLLGNFNELAKRLGIKREFPLDTTLHTVQVNVSFFVHTFFFVLIGLTFNIEAFNYTVLKTAALVFMILLVVRILSVKALAMSDKMIAPFSRSMITMMPRGLAAGVLASMPLAAGINIPHFAEIVFSIIIFTNLLTAAGVFFIERTAARS